MCARSATRFELVALKRRTKIESCLGSRFRGRPLPQVENFSSGTTASPIRDSQDASTTRNRGFERTPHASLAPPAVAAPVRSVTRRVNRDMPRLGFRAPCGAGMNAQGQTVNNALVYEKR